MWQLWVKFFLGQNEDYRPGDSLSDSCEELLQRGKEGGQYTCDFSKTGIRGVKHTFWQKVAASQEEQMSPLMILVLFEISKDARIWAHTIFPWKYLSEGLFYQFSPEHREPLS